MLTLHLPAKCLSVVSIGALLFTVAGPARLSAQTPPAIESAVFEYQAMAGNAHNIDLQIISAINLTTHPRPYVVVATSADIGLILRLQTTLGEAALVKDRVIAVYKALRSDTVFQCKSPVTRGRTPATAPPSKTQRLTALAPPAPPPAAAPPAGWLASALANASSVAALLPAIQSLAMVSETAVPAAGDLSDISLITAIAGELHASGATALVPSFYPPQLATQPFSGTLIGRTISDLEKWRADMYDEANKRILSPQCQYTTTDKKGNTVVVNLAVVNQMIAAVTSAAALLDKFEGQLFGGTMAATPVIAPAPPTPAAPPAGGGAKPLAAGADSPGKASDSPKPTAQPPGSGGSALEQLLYADLTLQQLGATVERPYISSKNVYFVSVHNPNSGGTTLTAAAFLGSRVFYSGGAVSTFSIFDANAGTLLCSGISYAYRGSVSQHQMQLGINDAQNPGLPNGAATSPPSTDVLLAAGYFTTNCPKGS
ncbi:MAG TPA: hypothetical protein VGG70_00595 [Candidatus Cybelea sp.]